MQGKQKTLDSFDAESRAVPEGTHPEAQSTSDTQSEEAVAHSDLIEEVLDDENIVKALRRVVANNGAPGATANPSTTWQCGSRNTPMT